MTPEELITTFVTLFVIIDPIGLAPVFVSLTRGLDAPARNAIGLRAVLVAFGLLAVFGVAGKPLLAAIGIGLPAFRISGGLLLFLIAVDMLFEKRSQRREKHVAEAGADTGPTASPEDASDPSVFPLATPLIAGPGALATMILLGGKEQGDVLGLAALLAVMVFVLALTYAAFRAGSLIERLLGHNGVVVVTRLFGILLAALAVQFVLNGLHDIGVLSAPPT
jgi:multiple antibiotic resistance protein